MGSPWIESSTYYLNFGGRGGTKMLELTEDVLKKYLYKKKDAPLGIHTGFLDLDYVIGNLQEGNIYLLVGGFNTGKIRDYTKENVNDLRNI
jgi:hypothetical protein